MKADVTYITFNRQFLIFNLQLRQKHDLFLGAEDLWLLHCCISIYRATDCTGKISSALFSSHY